MSTTAFRPATADDQLALSALTPLVATSSLTVPAVHAEDAIWLALRDQTPVLALRVQRGIGLAEARHWFHVGRRVHAAPELNMFRCEQTLLLGNDHTGAAELSAFAAHPEIADQPLFVALTTQLISATVNWIRQRSRQQHELARVIAALPGPSTPVGPPMFWRHLGSHFMPGDVVSVMRRFGEHWESHVARLLPRHPIVASVLHAELQAAIGAIDPSAQFWRQALQQAGFATGQHIGIYDGGPVLEMSLESTWS